MNLQFRETWKSNTQYKIGDLIQYPDENGDFYRCIKNTTTYPTDTTSWSLFLRRGFNFQGLWEEKHDYEINDIVITVQGDIFAAKTSISESSHPKKDKRWDKLININWLFNKLNVKQGPVGPKGEKGESFRFRGIWNQKIRYNPNDIVRSNRNGTQLYISLTKNHRKKPPFKNEADWELFLGTSLNFRGKWQGSAKYGVDELVVADNGNIWRCLEAGINEPPGEEHPGWELVHSYAHRIEEEVQKLKKTFHQIIAEMKQEFNAKLEEIQKIKDADDIDSLLRDEVTIAKGSKGGGLKFKGEWEKYHGYFKDDLVLDPTVGKKLYLCLKDNASNYPPHDDNHRWRLIGEENSVVYRGLWKSKQLYHKNTLVLHQNEFYLSKNQDGSDVPPQLSYHWIKLSSGGGPASETGLFFGIYVRDSSTFAYDKKLGMTVCESEKSETNVYGFNNIKINHRNIQLPFGLVGRTDNRYFEYLDGSNSVIIVREGFYRVTYNISCHGSFYNMYSMISIVDMHGNKNKADSVVYSHNQMINRSSDDKQTDTYYCSQKNARENNRVLNHSFIMPIKPKDESTSKIAYKLLLNLRFPNQNLGKFIFVHPISTWISIERICDSQSRIS